MTKKETKLYYPYRDHILASNIIKILALNPETSSKEMGFKLSSMGGGHTPPSIRVALERLVDTGYVIKKSTEHKSQTHNAWELSCLGNIVSLTILNGNDFDSFVDQYKNLKFYKMIHVLIENSKREFVKLLIDRLNDITNDRLRIEKVALEWYNDMRDKISTMKIPKNNTLYSLQEKINRDNSDSFMIKSKGYVDNPMFRDTMIDRICY